MKYRFFIHPQLALNFMLFICCQLIAFKSYGSAFHTYLPEQLWVYQNSQQPQDFSSPPFPALLYPASLWSQRNLHALTYLPGQIKSPLRLPKQPSFAPHITTPAKLPEQLLRLIWKWPAKENSSPRLIPLCFMTYSDGLTIEELDFRDAATPSCPGSPHPKDYNRICLISLNKTEQDSTLKIYGGRFDEKCTKTLWQSIWPTEPNTEMALISYQPQTLQFPEHLLKINASLPDPQARQQSPPSAPPVLPGYGDSNYGYGDDDKRPPGFYPAALIADILIILPGLPDQPNELIQENPDEIRTIADDRHTYVRIRFNTHNSRQEIRLPIEQWHTLVEHGLHRSPFWLQHILERLHHGLSDQRNFREQLEKLLKNAEQSSYQDEPDSQQHSAISLLLDEIINLPPESLSIEGAVQTLYEEELEQQTSWSPTQEESAIFDQQNYLRLLRKILSLLLQGDQLSEELEVTLAEAEQFNPGALVNLLDLEELLSQRVTHITLKLLHHAAVITTPLAGGEKKTIPSRQPPPTSSGQQSLTSRHHHTLSSPRKVSHEDDGNDDAPQGQPITRTTNGQLSLKAIARERVDTGSTMPELTQLHDCNERIDQLFSLMNQELRAGLTLFLNQLLPWGYSGKHSWLTLEKQGLLSKGLILTILYSQDIPATHPFILRIKNSDKIYQRLEQQGINSIWSLLGLPPSTLNDALNLAYSARSNPVINQAFSLEHPAQHLRCATIWEVLTLSSNPKLQRVRQAIPESTELSEETRARMVSASQLYTTTPAQYEAALHSLASLNLDPWHPQAPDHEIISMTQNLLANSRQYRHLRIQSIIARSSYSTVFSVRAGDKELALKIIPQNNAKEVEALSQSASLVDELRQFPEFHSVTISQEFMHQGTVYLQLMEKAKATFKELFTEPEIHPQIFYRQYFNPALHQVSLLHARGIYHQDLKPENIGIMPDGRIALLDLDMLSRAHLPIPADCSENIGTPQTSSRNLLECHLNQATKYYPELQDMAGLGHIWLHFRLRQPTYTVFLKNMIKTHPQLSSLYDGKVLSRNDQRTIMLTMYQHLKTTNIQQLFKKARIAPAPVDELITSQLLLAPSVCKDDTSRLLSVNREIAANLPTMTALEPFFYDERLASRDGNTEDARTPLREHRLHYWLGKVLKILSSLQKNHANGIYWYDFRVQTARVQTLSTSSLNLNYIHGKTQAQSGDNLSMLIQNLSAIAGMTCTIIAAHQTTTNHVTSDTTDITECIAIIQRTLAGTRPLTTPSLDLNALPIHMGINSDELEFIKKYYPGATTQLALATSIINQFLHPLLHYYQEPEQAPPGGYPEETSTAKQLIKWYQKQLKQIQNHLHKTIGSLIIQRRQFVSSELEQWLSTSIPETTLTEFLQHQPYFHDLIALLRGNPTPYFSQTSAPSQSMSFTYRQIILGLRAFQAGDIYQLLPFLRPETGIPALPLSNEQLLMGEFNPQFRRNFHTAERAQALLSQQISPQYILQAMQQKPPLDYSQNLSSSLSSHPFSVLIQWQDLLTRAQYQDTAPQMIQRVLMNLELLANIQRTLPRPQQTASCPECRRPMQFCESLSLANTYYVRNERENLFGIFCEACFEQQALLNYNTNQASVTSFTTNHCPQCRLDLCNNCIDHPPQCTALSCGATMYLTTRNHLEKHNPSNQKGRVSCSTCRCNYQVDYETQIPTTWHCQNNHNLCQACYQKLRTRRSNR